VYGSPSGNFGAQPTSNSTQILKDFVMRASLIFEVLWKSGFRHFVKLRAFLLTLFADAIAQSLTCVTAEPHLTHPGERVMPRNLTRDLHQRGMRVIDDLGFVASAQLAVHFSRELFVIHAASLPRDGGAYTAGITSRSPRS
jgi:hypothetical protein